MRQPLLFRAYPRTGMRTDEEYRSLSADLFSGVGFPLFCNRRLWHNGVSCCFVMKELAVTNFCFFATGGCAVTVYFCCLASGSFSLQIFLSVLPGDIYLWVFLFRNKRFFATFFNCFVTDGFAAAIFCRGALTEDLVPTISTVLYLRFTTMVFGCLARGGFVLKFFYFFATIFFLFRNKAIFRYKFFQLSTGFSRQVITQIPPSFSVFAAGLVKKS